MAGAVGIARRAAAAGLDRDRRRRRPPLADAGGGPAAGRRGRCGRAVPMRRERGIALLLVMWLTMLLAAVVGTFALTAQRSEEHTSELQSLMRSSYAVFCLKNKSSNTAYST